MAAPRAGRPVTVRLYPLNAEHTLPMAFDLGVFFVAAGVWTGLGLSFSGWALLPLACVCALAHAIQMFLFVYVRFDSAGITIVRPWRRRRFEWAQVAGLVYTQMHTATPGPDPYLLRLVRTGHEPPYGRFLTGSEKDRYARGAPVVMRVLDPATGPGTGSRGWRAAQCQERVLAELERYGLPRPKPLELEFRIRGEDPEEAERAIAADFIRQRDAARNPLNDDPAW